MTWSLSSKRWLLQVLILSGMWTLHHGAPTAKCTAMRSEFTPAKGFIVAGLLALWCGALFGVIGSWQHVVPNVIDAIPFVKSRPLHVSLVIAWIFLTAVGGVYHYLPKIVGAPLHSTRLAWLHLAVFVGTGFAVIVSYFMGRFGGREY